MVFVKIGGVKRTNLGATAPRPPVDMCLHIRDDSFCQSHDKTW